MKAKIWINLALIAALVGLSLYVYFKPWQSTPPALKLATFKRDDIDRISVEPRTGTPYRLEKSAGEWRIVAPLQALADQTQVDRLLDIASAPAKQKLAHPDRSQLGLDPPQVRVTLNDRSFDFGRVNDITYEQYVAVAGEVYLVPPLYGSGIPLEAAKLLSRRLLAPQEIPVSFDFGRYRIVRDDKGVWSAAGQFATAPDKSLSQDDFNRWADEWRYTSALRVAPATGGNAGERLIVRFKDGRNVTLRVLKKQPQFELVRDDNALRYSFGVDVGRRLLDPRVVAANQ